jgi:hypothetical protein
MPSIYVSYSRSDAPSTVWRVVERLVDYYGDRAVQGSPPSGTDIEEDVVQSALVVAVIGPRWSTLTGPDLDLISRELETALGGRVPIVPVIVEGAAWPPQGDLPAALKKIASISAPKVGDETFDADMRRLTALLDLLLQTSPASLDSEPEEAASPAEATPPPRPASRFKLSAWRPWRRSGPRDVALSAASAPSGPQANLRLADEITDKQDPTEESTTADTAALDSAKSAPAASAPKQTKGNEAEPAGKMDTVEFGASYPQGVQIGVPFIVDAWVFPQELREAALRRAKEQDAAAKRAPRAAGVRRRGSRITVKLELRSCEVEPRAQTIFWNGTISKVSFAALAKGDVPRGKMIGTLSFLIKGLRIGQVAFELALVPTKQDERQVVRGAAVRNAFASYAGKDRRRVLARMQGLKELGVNVFMGARNLKANDPYPLHLLKHIDDSDVLYLFWSRHAQNSEWVEREWRYGKARKGIEFIDPVPLVDPRLVSPPEALGEENRFENWVVAYLEAEKGANAWRRFLSWAAGG